MSLNVNTISPAGSALTIGDSGDTIVVADDIKVNTVKDAGGNTLWVSNGSGVLSSVSSGFGGALNLISTQTASDSASLSFTSGIDSTYKEYVFKFININPATNDTAFKFQAGSSYNTAITSTTFRPWHREDDGSSGLAYVAGEDQAQGTAYQSIGFSESSDADNDGGGELHLFNPSSTTYVKNFYSRFQYVSSTPSSVDFYLAGYLNTTSAITQVQFKMASGNFDGKIKMYGVS